MEYLINWFNGLDNVIVKTLALILGVVIIGCILSLIFSLITSPFMYVYNKATDKNVSNVINEDDYIMGELTEKIEGDGTGQVLTDGALYPAKLYKEKDIAENLLLKRDTHVIIIEVKDGIAYVVKNNGI